MKIRSIDLPRKLQFPDDQTLLVTPEGVEVPKHLEVEARKAVALSEHLEEVKVAAPKPGPKPEVKE